MPARCEQTGAYMVAAYIYFSVHRRRQTLLSPTSHKYSHHLNYFVHINKKIWHKVIYFHCYLITVYKFYISLGNEIRMFIPNPSKDQYRDVQHTGGSMGVSSLLCCCISSGHIHARDTFVMDFTLANLR